MAVHGHAWSSVDGLRAWGVRFLIYRNTLKAMGLRNDPYGVDLEGVVPSGMAELARLQCLNFVCGRPR